MTNAVLLNVMSLAVVSAVFTMVLQLALSNSLLRVINHASVKWQKTLLWCWMALPLVVGVLCSGAFMLNAFTDVMWAPLDLFIHWHHLFSFEWLSWHGGLLAMWLLATVWIVVKHCWLLFQHQMRLQTAIAVAQGEQHNLQGKLVTVLNTSAPLAFTAGMLRPKIYLSQGLLDSLSDTQQVCVITHENAHKSARDPMQKWLFSIFSAYYPVYIRQPYRQAFDLAAELQADYKACNVADPLDVATTLIQVGKWRVGESPDLGVAFGQDFLRQRVQYLLNPANSNSRGLVFLVLVSTGLLTTNLLSVDSIHHYIELLLNL